MRTVNRALQRRYAKDQDGMERAYPGSIVYNPSSRGVSPGEAAPAVFWVAVAMVGVWAVCEAVF